MPIITVWLKIYAEILAKVRENEKKQACKMKAGSCPPAEVASAAP
jgi:hypothetical protein